MLKTFDFEERQLGNVEDLPMDWVKVHGPALPHYNNGRLDRERVHGGRYSFRFDLDGGGLIYSYGSRLIPVVRGAHYRIEGFCQTTVLHHARARISAFFADQDGHPLAGSTQHSELYGASRDNEGWRKLRLELSAEPSKAAWLVIQLELLQPAQYQESSLGERALFGQDVRGSAWFDDITISQVPHVVLGTRHPGNIFRAGELPQVDVSLSDSFTQDLVAQIAVTDAEEKLVYQQNGALQTSVETGDPSHVHSRVALPRLAPGWYRAAVSMTSRGQLLGTHSLDLVVLPDGIAASMPDPRFGIDATSLSFDEWEALPQILPIVSAGRVKLAVWSAQGDVEQADAAGFESVLDQLQRRGITPTACLLDVPPKISEKWSIKSWEGLLRADPREWRPQLAYLVSRHASQLDRWQLGADGSDAFITNPKMRQVYALINHELAALLQTPDLAMPWPAWYELGGELPTTVALAVPTAVLPNQLPLYMQEVRRHEGHNLSLSMEPLDAARYGRLTQIRDLAQRVIYALGADARRLDFPIPYTISREDGQSSPQPSELLMILRTLTAALADTTYKGKVSIGEDVEAFLFDHNGQGILALWNRGTIAEVKELAINLGPRPMKLDLWGNLTPLPRVIGDKNSGNVRLTVGPMPMFLIDIDGPQAQLRASVAIDQPLMESSFQAHTRKLRFVNPYPQAIAGTLVLRPPTGWTITPATIPFNLNSGQSFERELQISFPYNSLAGKKVVDCAFDLQGEAGSTFNVPIELRLELGNVGMQALAVRRGNDVFVQQTITNYSEQSISYDTSARCPGEVPQYHLVHNLGPGQTTIRRYLFTNTKVAEGTKIRVGMKEFDGIKILNLEVPVQ